MADIVFPGQNTEGVLNADALPENNDLVIYKGDFVRFTFTVPAGPSLVGATAKAVLKTDYSDRESRPFTCTITDETARTVTIYMPSSITSNLLPGSYIWDFQITFADSDTRTYLAGDVTVYNEVTT